jgi:hypothetical protein
MTAVLLRRRYTFTAATAYQRRKPLSCFFVASSWLAPDCRGQVPTVYC